MPAPRCPHCHSDMHALADGSVPLLCPYCGDELPVDVGPSLATLLRAAPAAADRPAAPQDSVRPADSMPHAAMPEAARTAEAVTQHDAPAPTDMEPPAARELRETHEPLTRTERAEAPATGIIETVSASESAASASPRFIASTAAAPRRRHSRWQWPLAAALTLMLGMQLLYVQRDVLASHAQWRPWIARLCIVTGCTLAPWRELSAFRMLGREVRAVAGQHGVLQVQATFRNDARWPQPLPDLRVSLSDADGQVLGARTLGPRDYLAGGDPDALIAPGQSVQATALLKEPDSPSVAFAFEFR